MLAGGSEFSERDHAHRCEGICGRTSRRTSSWEPPRQSTGQPGPPAGPLRRRQSPAAAAPPSSAPRIIRSSPGQRLTKLGPLDAFGCVQPRMSPSQHPTYAGQATAFPGEVRLAPVPGPLPPPTPRGSPPRAMQECDRSRDLQCGARASRRSELDPPRARAHPPFGAILIGYLWHGAASGQAGGLSCPFWSQAVLAIRSPPTVVGKYIVGHAGKWVSFVTHACAPGCGVVIPNQAHHGVAETAFAAGADRSRR